MFLLSGGDPVLDRGHHGENACFDGLDTLGRDHDTTLDNQGQEVLKAGEKGHQRGGIDLLGNALELFDLLHAGAEHVAWFQNRQSLDPEPVQVLRNAGQCLS